MLPITKMITNYNKSPRNGRNIKAIVIHDVGAVSSAKNNAVYFNGGNRGASADFFVDSTSIYQIIDYKNNYSWSIGDGKGVYGYNNSDVVSIEMCLEDNWQPSEATIQNTIDLVKYLMNELGLGIDNVVRHFDCSRKQCPNSFSTNNWAKWNEFKARLSRSSEKTFPITMYAHVQNMGNLEESNDNQCGIGTVDKSLRLEGICMKIDGVEFEYFAHIQYVGDTPKMSKGCYLGTMGMARRIEGFQIDVTSIPSGYKLQYRGNVQFKGMTDWIDSGNFLGTRGEDLRLEYIEVRVIKA